MRDVATQIVAAELPLGRNAEKTADLEVGRYLRAPELRTVI